MGDARPQKVKLDHSSFGTIQDNAFCICYPPTDTNGRAVQRCLPFPRQMRQRLSLTIKAGATYWANGLPGAAIRRSRTKKDTLPCLYDEHTGTSSPRHRRSELDIVPRDRDIRRLRPDGDAGTPGSADEAR